MVRIFVDSEDYNKLTNGEVVKALVECRGERIIECSLTHGKVNKKPESTGWDNPPAFTSLEQRDSYYK